MSDPSTRLKERNADGDWIVPEDTLIDALPEFIAVVMAASEIDLHALDEWDAGLIRDALAALNDKLAT